MGRIPERYKIGALHHLLEIYGYGVEAWRMEEVAGLFYDIAQALKEKKKTPDPPEEGQGS